MHFRFSSAGRMGTPAPPAVPLPWCRWEQLPIRGRRGPSLPVGPSLPHLRKTGFCIASGPLPQSYKGGQAPTKPCVLRKCGVSPSARWAARFRSRWEVGGDTPPHHPPDLSRGAPGASLSVGARLRPVSALPRPPRSAGFAAPRPGRLRPSLAPPQRRPYRVRLRPCTLRAVSASAIA